MTLRLVALTVLLIVAGCSSSEDEPPLRASFRYTVDLDTSGSTVCTVRSVTFTDSSTGNPTSWHWDFGDGTTSSAQNPVLTPATPGPLTVALEVRRGEASDRHLEEIVFPTC